MRIDIHTHTRKVKIGDAATRNIEAADFSEILRHTDVKIMAITNHNIFDAQQYAEIRDSVKDHCQIWPGIELDIFENGNRAHLLVIANPKNYVEFGVKAAEILTGTPPDNFSISLQDTVNAFDHLDCIYVAHYLVKKPNLGDAEIDALATMVGNPKRILKEATNSIAAGIYISHGHNSIYGSDVQDWKDYGTISKQLPELRLPVESFEQFCLLLQKDEATINTILNKKVKDTIEFALFSAAELVRLDIYNDINILFGSKGTGKTAILDNLSKWFNNKGHRTSVYKSNDTHVDSVFDIKATLLKIAPEDVGVDECLEEIEFVKNATEEEVTSMAKYQMHFSTQETNKISQKLKIKNMAKVDGKQSERFLNEVNSYLEKFEQFSEYIAASPAIANYVGDDLIKELLTVLEKISVKLISEVESGFFTSRSIHLLNNIIDMFIKEIAKKTGQPPKPTTPGFAVYASNRIKIELAIKKILKNINIKIEPIVEYAGSLGAKGELQCKTNLIIESANHKHPEYSVLRKANKTTQAAFAQKIKSIEKHLYSNDLFQKITELNEIDGVDNVKSICDLILKYRHFLLDGEAYRPSNGESSMILLHKELMEDKDIYLIDEPEKSLGNDYINDVIVPLLKEKALLGKKVVVATHDANIAVRTLPYNSIYRLHDQSQYFTMTGNPFSNTLKCIHRTRQDLDWKEISMKTLEGGKDAFGERGKIYGN